MSDTFKIEKDIPMPGIQTNSGKYKATFTAMDVGDSFFIAVEPGHEMAKRSNVWSHAKKHGYKVSFRKEIGGFRVWLREKPTEGKP